MRSLCRLLSILFAIAILSTAQSSTEKLSTFRSKTQLVVVPVVVTNKNQAVRGLSREDFEIRYDNERARIATFEEVVVDHTFAIAAPKNGERTAQNFVQQRGGHGDVALVLLDFLNSSWSSAARMRTSMGDVARELTASGTPFAVYALTTKGLISIHSLSNTPEDFSKLLERAFKPD